VTTAESWSLRSATATDLPALIALWQRAGLVVKAETVPDDLAGLLTHGPELVLVAEEHGELIGSVVGSFDGRRGWLNRLATDPAHRGRGIAKALLAEVHARLAARGCRKVNLLIEPENAEVLPFYAAAGYTVDDLIFMERWLPAGER
jgi:ribosomal protein S18 acetylase RimI-like enzyme